MDSVEQHLESAAGPWGDCHPAIPQTALLCSRPQSQRSAPVVPLGSEPRYGGAAVRPDR